MKSPRRESPTFPEDDAYAAESQWQPGAIAARPVVNKIPPASPPRKAPKDAPPGLPGDLREVAQGGEALIEGRFRMPAADYRLIGEMKRRARAGGLAVKKSQLLRAGLRALLSLDDEAFRKALASLGRTGS
jgi:hypothetical protein